MVVVNPEGRPRVRTFKSPASTEWQPRRRHPPQGLRRAERLLDTLPLAARIVDEHGRRLLNQFFFEKVLVQGHQVVTVIFTETARLILGYPSGPVGPGGPSMASKITFYRETNPDPLSGDRGSNIDSLVGAAGVEPATARV